MRKHLKPWVFSVCTGTTVGCTASLLWYLLRHKIRIDAFRTLQSFVVPGSTACSSCKGTAVELIYHPGLLSYACKDQQLCEVTVAYAAMLNEVPES